MRTPERTFDPVSHDDCLTEIDAERVPVRDTPLELRADLGSRHPRVGDVLAGRYELEASLGATALGEMFVARMLSLHARVTLYVVHGALGRPSLRNRLCREVQGIASVRHRHLGRILDFVKGEPTFVVLEDLPGRSLATLLAEQGPLDWRSAAGFALEVAGAVAAMHAAGVVHGNVEAASVVLAPEGGGDEARLVGFGFAVRDPAACEAWSWTDAEASDDVRRLGAMLYELVTGTRPPRDLGAAHGARRLRDLLAERGGGALTASMRELCAIVERATSDAPARRFGSARELAEALRALLAGAADRAQAPRRPHVLRWIVVALFLASVAAALGFSCAHLIGGWPFVWP